MSITTFSKGIVALVIASAFATVMSANANILVYEGFQYGPAYTSDTLPGGNETGTDNDRILHGEPDGIGTDIDATGLSGTWNNSNVGDLDNMFLMEDSLSFGDLATSGNHIRHSSNLDWDVYSRSLTSGAQAGVSGASELWFSFTANKLMDTAWGAEEEGFVFGSDVADSAKIDDVSMAEGFGVGWKGELSGWTAYGWGNGTQVIGGEGLSVAKDGSDTRLLVGEISYDTGTGGADVFTLYEYLLNNGSIEGGTLSQITSIEVNADQSLLDTLNLTRQVNTAFDEIRIGTTSDDVITVIPEPSTLALAFFGLLGVFLRRPRRK